MQHRIELNPEIGSCRIAQIEPNRCKANSERFPAIGCWSMQICALIGCITDLRGDFFRDWWLEDCAGRWPQGVKHRLMGKASSELQAITASAFVKRLVGGGCTVA